MTARPILSRRLRPVRLRSVLNPASPSSYLLSSPAPPAHMPEMSSIETSCAIGQKSRAPSDRRDHACAPRDGQEEIAIHAGQCVGVHMTGTPGYFQNGQPIAIICELDEFSVYRL